MAQARDQLVQVELGFERCGLLLQSVNQLTAAATRQTGYVVNRFVGVQRHALATDLGQGVDHVCLQALQAQLEHLEQTHRTRANDQGVDGERC